MIQNNTGLGATGTPSSMASCAALKTPAVFVNRGRRRFPKMKTWNGTIRASALAH